MNEEKKYKSSRFEIDWRNKMINNRDEPSKGYIEHEILFRKEILLQIEKNNQILLNVMDLLNERLQR